MEELLRRMKEARREGRPADARDSALSAVTLARELGDAHQLPRALNALAQVERDLGHVVAAIELYTEIENLHRRSGNAIGVAHALRHQADIHRERGLPELAESLYEEAMDKYRAERDTEPMELANALRGLALLKSLARQAGQARPLWEEARRLYESGHSKAGVDECDLWLTRMSGSGGA